MPGKNNFFIKKIWLLMKVDFIQIGAGKAATTWIYKCLAEHPQICLGQPKEMNFFCQENLDFKSYFKQFKHCHPDQIKGESSMYLRQAEKTAPKIKQYFPQVKLIVSLRNPIEKIYSHYLSRKSKGCQEGSFEDFIKKEDFIARGFYYSQLRTFLKFFPKENILILVYEDIEKDPRHFIQKIYKFLGVDSNFVPPSLQKKINPTSKKKLFLPFFTKSNFEKTKNFLKNYGGEKLIKFLKPLGPLLNFFLRKNVRKIFQEGESLIKPPMKTETRKYLQKQYQKEIRNLEKLIDRNLSFWK